MAFTGTLHGPLLENILALLRQISDEPLKFRESLAKNAAYAVYFDQQVLAVGSFYTIEQAQSGAEYFTSMLIVFESTSGTGRYMVVPERASATRGFPVAGGASFLTIDGHQNIKNFSMTPEAAQTLRFARVLFR